MMHFLGSDQTDNRIRIFSNIKDENNVLVEHTSWRFPSLTGKVKYSPTDAKRVDFGDKISVIIAAHGAIFEVPFNYRAKTVFVRTYKSCHSVEKLPDGNLISASSRAAKLRIHYNKEETEKYITFKDGVDYPLMGAHGVIFDKKRHCVWALGRKLNQYKYIEGKTPELKLLNSYRMPFITGHDLFPNSNGNLLLTYNQGIFEYEIPTMTFTSIANIKNIKSIVPDIHTGDLYITIKKKIKGYRRWQTDTIGNLSQQIHLVRPDSKFYKVRLWQKNSFSY